MSLYEELKGITSDEARHAVGTVFAFVDSKEIDDSDLIKTLGARIFEIVAVGDIYAAMVDGISTTEALSDDEKESAKMAVAVALTSLTILAKAKCIE